MDVKDNSLALRARLEALPPELCEMIYDFTFTSSAATRMETSPDYEFSKDLVVASKLHFGEAHRNTLNARLPHLLHVDRQSRLQFAKSYYGSSDYVVYGYCHMIELLKIISQQHWDFIRSLRAVLSCGNPADGRLHDLFRSALAKAYGESLAKMIQLK